jgi:hypothetical protein
MNGIRTAKARSKTQWKWSIVALGMWASVALLACGVEEDEETPGPSAVEELVQEQPAPPPKEDAGIHGRGDGKHQGAALFGDCEWWGCPPVEPCGDDRCGPGEQTTCPSDCPGAGCGDGFCSVYENSSSCPQDCGAAAFCGDGVCNGGESSWSCPSDCGSGPQCGDGACNGGEDSWSCPSDCGPAGVCGNCICEANELQQCPTDCGVYIPDQPLCPQ